MGICENISQTQGMLEPLGMEVYPSSEYKSHPVLPRQEKDGDLQRINICKLQPYTPSESDLYEELHRKEDIGETSNKTDDANVTENLESKISRRTTRSASKIDDSKSVQI